MSSPLTLREVVTSQHPGARILTTSQPVPVLGEANVVALFDDDTKARAAVQRLEGLVADDRHLGVVTFSPIRWPGGRPAPASTTTAAGEVDPEGIARMTVRRAAVGAVLTFLVTGAVVGLVVGLVTDSVVRAVTAGIGVGLLVASVGGLIGAFSGFGGSDAWSQTFSPPGASMTMVGVVGVETDEIDEASRQLRPGAVELHRLDAGGRPA